MVFVLARWKTEGMTNSRGVSFASCATSGVKSFELAQRNQKLFTTIYAKRARPINVRKGRRCTALYAGLWIADFAV